MADPELTEEAIVAAMAKADTRVCVGTDRCYAFPDRLEDARQTCTPKGRCEIGWIASRGGRESFDVWLEVSTGLVKLIRQADGEPVTPIGCRLSTYSARFAGCQRWHEGWGPT